MLTILEFSMSHLSSDLQSTLLNKQTQPTHTSGSTAPTDSHHVDPDVLSNLAHQVNEQVIHSTEQIRDINEDIHILSINAKIESARAGVHGKGFSVVADSIRTLVARTSDVTQHLESEVRTMMDQLSKLSTRLGTDVRIERLTQAASNAMDILDRNLYERSCDIRWWATENMFVQLLENAESISSSKVSKRMGTILDSYSVYFDLLLCDTQGNILVNARPNQFANQGKSVTRESWFPIMMNIPDGDSFFQQWIPQSTLVANQDTLLFGTPVRQAGEKNAKPIGLLLACFRWEDLFEEVLHKVIHDIQRIDGTSRPVHGCILDGSKQLIGSTHSFPEAKKNLEIEALEQFLSRGSGYHDSTKQSLLYNSSKPNPKPFGQSVSHQRSLSSKKKEKAFFFGFSTSGCYETYCSGWNVGLFQEVKSQ
jgi:hypothetical protein